MYAVLEIACIRGYIYSLISPLTTQGADPGIVASQWVGMQGPVMEGRPLKRGEFYMLSFTGHPRDSQGNMAHL